jgi:hypothetical protein
MSRKIQTINPMQRVKIVMKYLGLRGANKESVNNVYRNILKQKFKGAN